MYFIQYYIDSAACEVVSTVYREAFFCRAET